MAQHSKKGKVTAQQRHGAAHKGGMCQMAQQGRRNCVPVQHGKTCWAWQRSMTASERYDKMQRSSIQHNPARQGKARQRYSLVKQGSATAW